MRLTDLHPAFLFHGGDGVFSTATGEPIPLREGVGLAFDCPGGCGRRHAVSFANPIDGGPAVELDHHTWQRIGDTFETLRLTPSLRNTKPPGCGWHGYVGRSSPGSIDTISDSECVAKKSQ